MDELVVAVDILVWIEELEVIVGDVTDDRELVETEEELGGMDELVVTVGMLVWTEELEITVEDVGEESELVRTKEELETTVGELVAMEDGLVETTEEVSEELLMTY